MIIFSLLNHILNLGELKPTLLIKDIIMKDNKILVLGYFGYTNNQLDGQTIKTRNIYEALSSNHEVSYFDTEVLKSNKAQFLILLKMIAEHDKVFFVGGKNNLRFFFPILYSLSIIQQKKIVYVVVGGWLYDFIKSAPVFYKYMLKNIRAILVETKYLKKNLELLGFDNVDTIPNFRLTPEYEPSVFSFNSNTLNVVFMARIMREKGIYLIFDLLENFINNSKDYNKKIKVDFFGPINSSDKDKFNKLIQIYSPYVSYKGLLQPDQIYYKLPQYDLLILPTFYEGEGFPGTILDAYLCGLPVITTKWKQLPEFVKEGETGFLIDYNLVELKNKVQLLMENEQLLSNMKKEAFNYSSEFSSETGIKILNQAMGI